MIEKTPNIESLMFSIQVASWEGRRQVEWIKRTGFAEDEISLQLDDFYRAVKNYVVYIEGEEFPEFLENGIQELLDLFEWLADTPELWTFDSIVAAKEWEVVRGRARRLLAEVRGSSWSHFLGDSDSV
ncbi:hypothetical protein KIK06_05270 [Nocardiopsis sp. EMB25]|uniref:hypothetical protein n=1 Tax=Nocardiopsis sp. EMB25 TaxID=2835867 RepID=UPI0022853730|nr:hypothetical protein [Nocardiopsis sp. EMB25]MCY9783304.1 hypothetical protein [Nocardiopsis sp. EMB25]